MQDLEILHFEQLKNEVQSQYLTNHTPSHDNIAKWKGIDIIYFQEDLRKIAKGNISEKSFYTYFKTSPSTKIPRIDMLNLLSIYAGYTSWYDFKKNHLFANEILQESENSEAEALEILEENDENSENVVLTEENVNFPLKNQEEKVNLQKTTSENQKVKQNIEVYQTYDINEQKNTFSIVKKYLWLGISAILAVLVGLLGFKDELFSKKFYYSFVDADRNSKINAELQVQILKEGESPIIYIAKPNEPFVYTTKSKSLKMTVSSPYYKTQEITRNLETAPEAETIELVPNDYAIMLFYYSKKDDDEVRIKKERLNYLISDNALIYQIYNNEFYGVERLDKQRYIALMTTPTTSLKNLEVIETQNDSKGKINMIKFRIASNEETK